MIENPESNSHYSMKCVIFMNNIVLFDIIWSHLRTLQILVDGLILCDAEFVFIDVFYC